MILDQAYAELGKEIPAWLARGIDRLRRSRWLRIPAGLALIAGSALWFLPVLGIEMLPLGLLLLAEDIPFLRKPLGKLILWLVDRWRALKAWWSARRA